ncbi:MAG: T9SS type A sorting domain-containing protein [bacterium]|nr:T9SS type A sorting domain-containing protein [bacterium]
MTIAKSILAFNEGYAITGSDNGSANLICSNIYGNPSGNWVGILSGQLGVSGNIEDDPLFCDKDAGILTLHHTSFCAPDNNSCGLMGAFPVDCFGTMIVEADGSGDYATIQAAVNVAHPGDTIQLGAGNFTGTGNRDIEIDVDISIESLDPENPGIIDCQGSSVDQHRAFMILGGTVDLSHLIIRNGYTDLGGGVSLGGGLLDLNYCQFENNTATMMGGGLHADNGDLVHINYCTFAENSAAQAGGAAYAGDSTDVRFNKCTLFLNESPAGSGIFLYSNAQGRINNCIIAWGKGSSACSDYFSAGFITGCNDIYANEGGDWVGVLAGQGGINNNNNIDPLFCDPMANPASFELMNNSPVGEAHVCGGMGAKATDPNWAAPVYGVRADESGMFSTIQSAVDAVPLGAIISLDDGIYTGDGNRDIELRGKALSIGGRNSDPTAVILDAEGDFSDEHRAFNIHEGEPETATLMYMTMRNGVANANQIPPEDYFGGAVRVTDGANLKILSCIFEDNVVHQAVPFVLHGKGGAIYHSSFGSLEIEDCVFSNQQGSSVIQNDSGSLQVSNSYFNEEFTGIQCVGMGQVNITECVFEDFQKPAVIFSDMLSPIQLQLCEFRSDNRVYGGAFFYGCDSIMVDQCTFEETGSPNIGMPLLLFVDSQATIQATTFIGNGTEGRGAVKCENSISHFSSCEFLTNNSPWPDGAVKIDGGSAEFQQCGFSDNTSLDGGGILAFGAVISMDFCTFSGNQAQELGGGGYFEDCTVTIKETGFSTNQAGDGGGLYSERCNLTVEDCTFDANSDGLRHHGSSLGGISIPGTLFTNHLSGWAAEIDSMLIRPVVIDHCTFRTSSQGLKLFEVPEFRVANTQFSDNPTHGTFTLSHATGAVDTCSFDRNSSQSEGGAVYMSGSNVSLKDCSFADNSSDESGGAVFQVEGEAVFTRCSFDHNLASKTGGGFACGYGVTTMTDCDFDNNIGSEEGGAIWSGVQDMNLNSCTITGGYGGFYGGGAFHEWGNTVYTQGLVEDNTAANGGGIYAYFENITFNDLEITGNIAGSGGGAKTYNSQTVFNNCLVSDNTATSSGGISIAQYPELDFSTQIIDTLIEGNSSSSEGSAISVTDSSMIQLQGCTVFGNGGEGSDGQLFYDQGGEFLLQSSIIAFSTDGSAVFSGDLPGAISAFGCDIYGNESGDWTEELAGWFNQECNFSSDPLLCDSANGDFHLADSSPCAAANNICQNDVGVFGVGCSGVSGPPPTDLPEHFALLGNSPNPFNPRTNISFELPSESSVFLEIFDVTGRRVCRLVNGEYFGAGSHLVTWNGNDDEGHAQSSGIYLYQIQSAGQSFRGKMAMIR